MAYYDIYRDQLASVRRGHALWMPDPTGLYDQVRIGDVGYVRQGQFLRMFNALLPANDNSQVYGVPEEFVPLNMGPFINIRKPNSNNLNLEYCSNSVTVDHGDKRQAAGLDEATSISFKRSGTKNGAFLSLPFSGVSEDALRTKAFETYIRKHHDKWLEFALINNLDVRRLEDITLVTGCDLTSIWAMATFMDPLDQEIVTLHVQPSQNGSAGFQWSHTSQPHNNEPNQNTVNTHCVFLRGFRAKRILPFSKTSKSAAGTRPDNPDHELESSNELRESTMPDYRDPLIGILDYIAEQRPNDELALAHDYDLHMIEGVDVLTADAVENFLRQNRFHVQTEEGVAFLMDEDEKFPEEEKMMTFHAQANVADEPLPLIVHPVLMKYLLKFDIPHPLDHDFGLPAEELFSSAVHPPVDVLILENEQGLPENIEVHVSDKASGIGVTVEDVLKSIAVDLRRSSSWQEWAALNEDVHGGVEYSFSDNAGAAEERSGGLRRIDYLRGRNRLQIFPKHQFLEKEEGLAQL